MRICALLAGMSLSQVSLGNNISWLGAAYLDTLNKANIKLGVVLNEPYEYDEARPHYYGSFKYVDFEVGVEGNKASIGVGSSIGHGIDRVGISYARMNTQDLAGIESVISQMGMSIKLGYYFGLDNTKNRWLLGVGLGF